MVHYRRSYPTHAVKDIFGLFLLFCLGFFLLNAVITGDSSRQEYWSGLPCPPPGALPNPGISPGLLHCRWILYHASCLGSPRILEWIAYPFSRGSSQLRNQTGLSCIAGGFFTSSSTGEPLYTFCIYRSYPTHAVKHSFWVCVFFFCLVFFLLNVMITRDS